MKKKRANPRKTNKACQDKSPRLTTTTSPLTEEETLARRLELAAGGIPIGITNKAGSPGDKCAHYIAMPGGPSREHPQRPKGPGPNDRGAHYYATTDPEIIRKWSLKYPGCHTLIGGLLPEDVACLDIDRLDEFETACPGLLQMLKSRGHPMDKRVGGDRYHIWVRVLEGQDARKVLPFSCSWGEVKWRGGLVVSSPSPKYAALTLLHTWNSVPRLTQPEIESIVRSKASGKTQNGIAVTGTAGRHPELLALTLRLGSQFHSREYIIDAAIAADLASSNPAQLDNNRPGDFTAEVERMVDGAIQNFGIGAFAASEPASRVERPSEPGQLPPHLLVVGGLAGEIADHINSQATVSNPELAFLAGITGVAHVCGRRIITETGLSPGMGIAALAPSASGKEKPQDILGEIFSRAGMGNTIVRKLASGQGLEDRLGKEPKLLLMIDEAMHMFRDMADVRQAPFSPESILKELLSGKRLYTGRVTAKVKGKLQDPVEVSWPHVTLYASAVPSDFFDTFNQQMIRGGLFGRLLCPVITPGPLVSPAPKSIPVPTDIIDSVRRWETMDLTADGEEGGPRIVPFSDRASTFWEEYRVSCHEKAHMAGDELRSTLRNRSAEKAARLALIRAASREGVQVETITLEDITWSCAVVDHYTEQLISKSSYAISANETERKRNKFLCAVLAYLKKNPGTLRAPHSFVSRYSKIDGQTCRQIAADLVDCEMIQIHLDDLSSNGKRPVFYQITDPGSLIHDQIHAPAVKLDSTRKGRTKAKRGSS